VGGSPRAGTRWSAGFATWPTPPTWSRGASSPWCATSSRPVGAESPPAGDDVFSVYLRAKAEADAAAMASDRDWTIVPPGALTDEPGTGQVRIDAAAFRGRVPRADVATVLEALLHEVPASRRILYVNGGADPIQAALERFAASADG
jgi:NAD(P)H-binding